MTDALIKLAIFRMQKDEPASTSQGIYNWARLLSMKKKYDIIAASNLITDIVVKVKNSDLKKMGLKKCEKNSKCSLPYDEFLDFVNNREPRYFCGGGPANSVYDAAFLGLACGLAGNLGDDSYAKNYEASIKDYGIESFIEKDSGNSMTCYILVTPDGEKTSLFYCDQIPSYSLDYSVLKSSKIFHTSGYELMTNPKRAVELVRTAKKNKCIVSFDVGTARAVESERASLEEILRNTDILFVTENELYALMPINSYDALWELRIKFKAVVFKNGRAGSMVADKNNIETIYSCAVDKPVNTNGAGDGYAAGFLYAYSKGKMLKDCGGWGAHIASLVCEREESHL